MVSFANWPIGRLKIDSVSCGGTGRNQRRLVQTYKPEILPCRPWPTVLLEPRLADQIDWFFALIQLTF